MSIHVSLHHSTIYKYDRPINLGPQIVRLRPAPHCRIPILSYSLKVLPKEHFINWQQDPQGNFLSRLVFPDKTDLFQVDVDLVAEMTVINPFDFFLEEYAEQFPFKYEPWLLKELKPFLEKTAYGEGFRDYVNSVKKRKQPTIQFLTGLNSKLHGDLDYLIRMEPGVQSPEETLEQRSGSCRDSAWLLVNILRHKGLAARFVSGYLIQLKPDVKSLDGPSGAESDFTDLHAWAEVYLPGAGWIGLDPTSGLLTGEGHIPLVATPEPSSAAPVTGSTESCNVEFDHKMVVTRIHEDPRVTKPFTPEQWEEVESIGIHVDKLLDQGDVKLTMGGEPTFVSIDDMEGREWNTDALGENKKILSYRLLNRLKDRWSKGALVYSGQGKWYPGEQLPRWIFGCYWRSDGKPVWKDGKLLADITSEYDFTTDDAKRFIHALADNLGTDKNHVIPGYEDMWYYMWREKRLPKNVDPSDSRIKDELERRRLARVFEKGPGEVTGYALPLTSEKSGNRRKWLSGPWYFRNKHMYLVPGDSPMGLRMPLDSLPWTKPEDIPPDFERDPFDQVGDLGEENELTVTDGEQKEKIRKIAKVIKNRSYKDTVRTALCVEEREGKIHVFIPPVKLIEDYLDLIRKIEKTAGQLDMPVVIEGYSPPKDVRMNFFNITPDPGVIEININPVGSWKALSDQTFSLYEETRNCRLGTEKFMLDGKHSGTGGGCHLVLGGKTPAESPFLRRPDLLASFISYWNNHPSLSYLFSGQFVGPTSQAPRVDEGRSESIYELEIALQQLEKEMEKYGQCPPWLVDRLFRHLLTDLTGNTHRAEFCIDKLYSPDTASGRLGLVEFRSFEMQPHPQMNLVQQLLIRALVARFWNNPYRGKLIRWNTTLHDMYLLPHFVREDFRDVIADLNDCGIDLREDFFEPHFEFRFPLIGKVNYRTIEIELRSAIEPWYVLGEEPAGGGTTRFVDSSVERMQVKISGLIDTRYVLICNGSTLPLNPTGTSGEYVAGLRYRAWQPPSCLHPTISVNTPLTFDLVDTWSNKSIGGCVYNVAHPGGRNYETYPVNAYEAEARRAARFFKIGHTPGKIMEIKEAKKNPDYPLTLDLRRS